MPKQHMTHPMHHMPPGYPHMGPPPPYPGYHAYYPPPPHHYWGPPPPVIPPPLPSGMQRSSDRFQSDVDGREGATSPSQIRAMHLDEVQHMGCTCKKTHCLKLYCQCFGVKLYCGSNCRCTNCYNTSEHENFRQEAIRLILSRNPSAFDTKFKKGPGHEEKTEAKTLAHKVGCKCRKSGCMKKVCCAFFVQLMVGLLHWFICCIIRQCVHVCLSQQITLVCFDSFDDSTVSAMPPTSSAVAIVVVWAAKTWETLTTKVRVLPK
jgi:hypothetical protein